MLQVSFSALSCVSQILIRCIFILIHFNVFFKISLRLTLWLMHYLEMYCTQCLEIFLLCFGYWFLICSYCRQRQYLYGFCFSKYSEDCFMIHDMVYLGICYMSTWKDCIFCYCWVQYFMNVYSFSLMMVCSFLLVLWLIYSLIRKPQIPFL